MLIKSLDSLLQTNNYSIM